MNITILVKKALRYIFYKASVFFHKIIIIANLYEQDLPYLPHNYNPRIEGTFKIIENIEDFDAFKLNFSSLQYELYRERLSKFQDKMLVFIASGKLAYLGWFTFGRNIYLEPEIGQKIIIPNDAVYYFDLHTIEDYQRKGIYAASFSYVSTFLTKFNKKKLIFVILTHNKAPIAYAKKSNFKIIKKLVLINFGVLKLKFNFDKNN